MKNDMPFIAAIVVVLGGAMLWALPDPTFVSTGVMALLAAASLTAHKYMAAARRSGPSALIQRIDRQYRTEAPDGKSLMDRMGPESPAMLQR